MNASSVSCTTCKRIIISQVWQCKNSHSYCRPCLLQNCILCGESLKTPIRNLAIEDQIKNSEDLHCNYSQYGCEFKGRFIDFSYHQSTCEYIDRPLPCSIPGCEVSCRKRTMISHLLNQHKANMSSSKVNIIEKGQFYVEVFRQKNCDGDWRNFEKQPAVYKRSVGDEERFYLLRIWTEEWILKVQVYSLTHECEPIRYLLDGSKRRALENGKNKNKCVSLCKTASHCKASPGFAIPVLPALNFYSYIHERGDIKALLFHISFASSDFFQFK